MQWSDTAGRMRDADNWMRWVSSGASRISRDITEVKMGRFDAYNERMVDHLRDGWLEPPDPDDEGEVCFSCLGEATLYIDNKFYCEKCAREEYADYSIEGCECSFCDDEVETAYKVGNDVYCENCFHFVFRRY
jgi:hypothetical protein